jgi:hypothetical protein
MTVLWPGDLVAIVMGAGDSAERSEPGPESPGVKADQQGPIKRASRREIGKHHRK